MDKINRGTRDLSSEIVKIPVGESFIEKSAVYDDRIIDFTFTNANTEYEIDIPLPNSEAPTSFEIITSSGGNIYADEEMRARWVGHKLFLKSATAGNTARIRVKY